MLLRTTPRAARGAPAGGAVLVLAATMAATTAPTAVAADLAFTGYARSRDDGRLLYVESHHVRDAGKVGEARVVLYRCSADGPAFARKVLTYSVAREQPEFTMTDARSGHVEGLRRTAAGPRVFVKENAGSPQREAAVPAGAATVSDAGFDEFVRLHWDELEAGKTVRFPFLIPSRLDSLTFKVSKHREATVEGAPASVIRLNLSGVFGWFLPYIEVAYRRSDRSLLRYEGLSNIRDAKGGNMVAVIRFPPAERRAVTDLDLTRLRAEPL
ncbi:MAG: hypothetical protein ACKO9D_09525, partial [Gammaproteobacteria bacterium]